MNVGGNPGRQRAIEALQLAGALLLLAVFGLLGVFFIKSTHPVMLIMVLCFALPLVFILIKFRREPKIPLVVNGAFLGILVLTAFIVLSLVGGKFLFGKSGALHVDVIIPAARTYEKVDAISGVLDVNPVPAGNMMQPVRLPDGTDVYATALGAMALHSWMTRNYEDGARGLQPLVFKVKKDTIRDRLHWAYIMFRGSAAGHPEGARGDPDMKPPDPIGFELKSLDGRTVALSGLRGRVVLMEFWWSLGDGLRNNMLSMQRLYAQLKDDGLEILAVDPMDYRDEAAVRGFVYNAGITFPVLLDMDGAVRKKYGLGVGDRKTFLLDRDGRILASLVWPGEWDAPPVVKLLRIILWRVKNEEAPL